MFPWKLLILLAIYAAWQHRATFIDFARQTAGKCKSSISRAQLWLWGKRALLAVAVGLFLFGGKLPSLPSISLPSWPSITIPTITPTPAVSNVTYVYEKSDSAIPSGVQAALNTLNRRDILATIYEDDTTDGAGEVPDQYRKPVEAARDKGMPAIVVMAGDEVVSVVVNPTTQEQILEAVGE